LATPHAFESLTPDFILAAIDYCGYKTDGYLMALNSYENRVYLVGVEDAEPIIAKFYRPDRWCDEAIQEEHEYCTDLAFAELPVVPPIRHSSGLTLHKKEGFRIALFERKGGRAPELDKEEHLRTLGRFLGRIHAAGAGSVFMHRPSIANLDYARESIRVVQTAFIPNDLQLAYGSLITDIEDALGNRLRESSSCIEIKVHGDCHLGNILWRDNAPHFVDFDDARMGASVQDIWMLLSGDIEEQNTQLSWILEGYSEFRDFDYREINLIEPLRTLRLIGYAAWIAKRWSDPAFPLAFPWFNTQAYWEKHVLELREQLAALQESEFRG
jgi:Ser/Thr protein kinase RdoA (MazF antagonist)